MKNLPALVFILLALAFAPFQSWAGMRMKLCVVDADSIASVQKDSAKIKTLLSETNKTRILEIDKAWHGIHYLLTGNNGPEPGSRSLVIFGGKEVGSDLGYGPARLLTPAEVKEVAKVLKEETVEKLSSKYDPMKMQKLEIYPDIWVRDGKEALDYLIQFYRELSTFYEKAAKAGSGVLVVIQ